MMSKQAKSHDAVSLLYRWMYPTVNPYSRGIGICVYRNQIDPGADIGEELLRKKNRSDYMACYGRAR
jgi:hypothetical protein